MAKFSHRTSYRQTEDRAQHDVPDLQEGRTYRIYTINCLPEEAKRAIYSSLIPPEIFTRFHIVPETLCNQDGEPMFTYRCRAKTSTVRLELRHKTDFPDPVFLLEMRDTSFGDLEILFININDPYSERFHIDRDPLGNDTAFGTISRNIPEEVRAMQAGLAPGQTRRGLRLFQSFLARANLFCQQLGIKRVKVEPMAYHNAIMHEFYGFRYMTGRTMMQDIDHEFAPGGTLFDRLDASTPFRQPGFERTIKGRSWAIHDGILGHAWQCPRMYYAIDEPSGKLYPEFTCHVFQRYAPQFLVIENISQ